ncbi:uncharacterized protein LOC135366205 [Ornithodoros turicata]|uniref:uncharacterized protein LOC135366205 n=1 Tax=Ornithodoros turicata TaxID=34597 RepID=UPI003138D264
MVVQTAFLIGMLAMLAVTGAQPIKFLQEDAGESNGLQALQARRVGLVLLNVGHRLKSIVDQGKEHVTGDDVSEYSILKHLWKAYKCVTDTAKGSVTRVASKAATVIQNAIKRAVVGRYSQSEGGPRNILAEIFADIENTGAEILQSDLLRFSGGTSSIDPLAPEEEDFVQEIVLAFHNLT